MSAEIAGQPLDVPAAAASTFPRKNLFQRVEAGDPLAANAVVVIANPALPVAELEARALARFQSERWWERPEYRALGQPIQTVDFRFSDGGHTEIVNWVRPLTEGEIAGIGRMLAVYSAPPISVPHCRYIPIVPAPVDADGRKVHPTNPNDGDTLNGYGTLAPGSRFDGIPLYEAALSKSVYRFGGLDFLPAIVGHELGHKVEGPVIVDWQKAFGWVPKAEFLERHPLPERLAKASLDGVPHICTQPERCVSDYAMLQANDDFVESLLAFVAGTTLDAEKAAFIRERITAGLDRQALLERADAHAPQILVVSAPLAQAPKSEETIYYVVQKPRISFGGAK